MLSEAQLALLRKISETWPSHQQLDLGTGRVSFAGHLLEGELFALSRGSWTSLPYFARRNVAWVTLAPDVEHLQAALAVLRAWILPSHGWEDQTSVVAPGASSGPLAPLLLSQSPSGYFRWWCSSENFTKVCGKLAEFRRLEAGAPVHVHERAASLFELRQEFELALITGDQAAAWNAIASIDHHQLDTAANTQFMRLRVLDQFREFERIVSHPQLPEIVQLRVPPAARIAILRGHHAVLLAPLESEGELDAARSVYRERIDDLLAGLIALSSLEDGPEFARLLGYRAWHTGDGAELNRLAESTHDPVIEELLADTSAQFREPPVSEVEDIAPVPTVVTAQTPRPTTQFLDALARGDDRTAQEVGLALLSVESRELAPLTRTSLTILLGESLKSKPNPQLAIALAAQAAEDLSIVVPAVPSTWSDFVERVLARDWESGELFLASDPLPRTSEMSLVDLKALIEQLEECVTDPTVVDDAAGFRLIQKSLALFAKEFITDLEFPRAEWVDLYSRLFAVWAESMRGSASRPASDILLTLANGLLEHSGEYERTITETVRQWWSARSTHAMLPFLLSALVLLSEYGSDNQSCESLWVEGADLIRRDSAELTPGERALWRRVGLKLGLDAAGVDAFLALDPAAEEIAADPIREAGFGRIAIVTLRERAARLAADIIRGRTDANVVIVVEEVPGTGAASAATADVILFMWLSNSHAVYRAFDGCRDRMEYVPGTNATSIVLALERRASRLVNKRGELLET